MDTILDMKKIMSSVCFLLLLTDVAWDNIFDLFMSGNCISVFFGEMTPVTNQNGGNFFMIR